MVRIRWIALSAALVASACSTDDACRVTGPAMETVLAEARRDPYSVQVNRAAVAEMRLIEACEAIKWSE